MLRAEKDGVFSRTYRITEDGREVTSFRTSWWASGGTFVLDGREFTIRSNMWGGKYGMADDNEAKVAAAEKVGRRDWSVESDGEVYRFRRTSILRSEQALMRDGHEVGLIKRASRWKGGATAELPGLSLPVRVFVVAVVLTMWEQEAAAASAGGGGS